MRADHVTMIGIPMLRCGHCKDLHLISERITVMQLAEIAKGFALMHSTCRRPELKEQSELFPEPEDNRGLFEKMYPQALNHGSLWTALRSALSQKDFEKITGENMKTLHPESGVFDAVAHWARCQIAAQDAEHRASAGQPGIPGLTIPKADRPDWLVAIIGAEGEEKPKGKRAKK